MKTKKFLIILILFSLIIRFAWLTTLIERDEGSFGYIGWRIVEGDSYSEIVGNKPPLIYLTYAFFISVFGNSIIPIRIFNNFLFLTSLPIFYYVSKHFFNEKTSRIATLFYAFFMNIPIFEGPLAMTESFIVFFSLISILCYLKSKKNKSYYWLSSLSAFIAVLFKQTGIIIYFLFIADLIKKKKITRRLLIYFTPFIASFFFVLFSSDLRDIFFIFFRYSLNYFHYYLQYIPVNYVLLILFQGIPLFVFSTIGVSVYKNKFLRTWFVLSLIVSIMPNSYGHYYLQLVPVFSLFAARGFVWLKSRNLNFSKGLLIFFILFSLIFQIKQWPNYNVNLIEKIDFSDSRSYQQQIKISEFIKNKTNEEDEILIWGNEPSIAWLSERKTYKNSRFIYCDSTHKDEKINIDMLNWVNFSDEKIKLILIHPQYDVFCEGKKYLELENKSLRVIGKSKIYFNENKSIKFIKINI